MKRSVLSLLMLLILPLSGHALAQESVFPLPAPLYILTSDHQILHVDPQTGEQTLVSPEGQRVLDFDIAPDGEWYAYRTEDTAAVIIGDMKTISGYVVEFLERMPSLEPGRRTIAWSPDASVLAYTVPEGVRIAALGAGEYGAPILSTVQGPWVELDWADAETILASDAAGDIWTISGGSDQWTVEQSESVSALPQRVVSSNLIEAGVALDDDTIIPRTAGALSYDWGLLPLPAVDGLVLPTDLYFLSADDAGIAQVWQLPRNGDPVRVLTDEAEDITAYAAAPTGGRIAYVVTDELFVSDLNGTNRQMIATLQTDEMLPGVSWSPDSTQIAFHDGRGVWTVPADGTQPQRVVLNHYQPANQMDAVNIQVYLNPRWSPDGSRLLVTIALWEGSILGVIDLVTGTLNELPGVLAFDALWTSDGRVLGWAWAWGYSTPGLFLLDPAQPDAAPVAVLDSSTPVMDMYEDENSRDWYALVAATVEMGPQYVRVLMAENPAGPYAPVPDTAGGFVRRPQLFAPGAGDFWVAGLHDITYIETGQTYGDLIILDLRTGETVQLRMPGPVWNVVWG